MGKREEMLKDLSKTRSKREQDVSKAAPAAVDLCLQLCLRERIPDTADDQCRQRVAALASQRLKGVSVAEGAAGPAQPLPCLRQLAGAKQPLVLAAPGVYRRCAGAVPRQRLVV